MMDIEREVETLNERLQTVANERRAARKEFKKVCSENRETLTSKVEEAFTHFLDSFIRIDGFYDEESNRPSDEVLNYQSQLLSRFMAMKAQKNYIELARSQNGQLARHLTKTKFDMEDEKDEMQQRLVEQIKASQNEAARLRVRWSKQVVIQRSALKSMRFQLNISDDSWSNEVPQETQINLDGKRNRRSWLRFSVNRSKEKEIGSEMESSQDNLKTTSDVPSPITTTATALLQNNWFSLPTRRRSHQDNLKKNVDDYEETRRRRSMDDDWAIPDMPWGTCITMEDDEMLAPPQLRATQSAPVISMVATGDAVAKTEIDNVRIALRSSGASKKTLEVLDDFDMTFAPLEQLMAAREQKSFHHIPEEPEA